MNFTTQVKLGFSGYGRAHRFIKEHSLWWYLAIPMLINAVVFTLLLFLGWESAGMVANWFFDVTGLATAEWGNMAFMQKALELTLNVLLQLVVLIIFMATFRYLVLILLAPVLALVSEKVEELVTGNKYPFSFQQFLHDVLRGVVLAIRNGAIEIGLTIVLLLFSFVPVIGFVSPVLIFGVESYFYGFSMIDYYSERQKLNPKQSNSLVWRLKWLAISNGAIFNGLLLGCSLLASAFPLLIGLFLKIIFIVPVLGLSLAPVYSVIAATLSVLEVPEETRKQLAHA